MNIIDTHIRATSSVVYNHSGRLIFRVARAFEATWCNPIKDESGWIDNTSREAYNVDDLITGESWRPEGVIMCRKATHDGYTIPEAREMFLGWVELANCTLCLVK